MHLHDLCESYHLTMLMQNFGGQIRSIMGNVEVAYRLQTVYLFLHLGSACARASCLVPSVTCITVHGHLRVSPVSLDGLTRKRDC